MVSYHGETTRDNLEIMAFLGALDVLRQGGEEGGDVIAAVQALLIPSLDDADSIGTVGSESTQPRLQNDVCAFRLRKFGFGNRYLNRTGLFPGPGRGSGLPQLAVHHTRRRCHETQREKQTGMQCCGVLRMKSEEWNLSECLEPSVRLLGTERKCVGHGGYVSVALFGNVVFRYERGGEVGSPKWW